MKIIINQDVVVLNLMRKNYNGNSFYTFGLILNKDKSSNKNVFLSCSYWGDKELKQKMTLSNASGILKVNKGFLQFTMEDFESLKKVAVPLKAILPDRVIDDDTPEHDWLYELGDENNG